jgi:hypothetical protein
MLGIRSVDAAGAGRELDLADFDAVGVAADIVVALRAHAIGSGADAVATVPAPGGWHRVNVTARSSGHVVLSVRYTHLTASRLHNVALALAKRGWDLDEDGEGATFRLPPGSEPTAAAFEVLAAATVGGAPAEVRLVTAVDAEGTPISLA